jgi:hypothetical protein
LWSLESGPAHRRQEYAAAEIASTYHSFGTPFKAEKNVHQIFIYFN